jgi:MYXO-CTERM domain-containing protein
LLLEITHPYMKTSLLLPAVLGSMLAGSAHAAVLAGWDFETNAPTLTTGSVGPTIAAETGSGNFAGFHASSAANWNTITGNGSVTAWGSDDWTTGDYYQFSTSSAGYENITISFDQIGTGRSPQDFQFSYSTDGTNFIDFGSAYSVDRNRPGNTWSSTTSIPSGFSFDLSGISALDNATTIYFRLTQVGTDSVTTGLAVAPTGFDRLDNVTISGTVVPEPAAALLGAIGLAGLFRRRR